MSVAASAKGASSGSGGSCFQVVMADDAGHPQVCAMQSTKAPGHIVCNAPGTAAGSCPSANLDGCCVQSVTASGPNAPTNLFTTCYYGQTAKQAQAQQHCTGGSTWQTTVP